MSGKVVIKIPVTDEGIKAIKLLAEKNIPVLATTIYTVSQAVIAALAGAKYVAPYVNRIDNLSGNGVKVTADTAQLFHLHGLDCEIIAASFKSVKQIHEIYLSGVQSVTVSPELIEKLIDFPATALEVAEFKKQWQQTYGENRKTLIDI